MPDPTLNEILERLLRKRKLGSFYLDDVRALGAEIERQASEIERLREYIECYGENELALYDSMAAALNEEEPDA